MAISSSEPEASSCGPGWTDTPVRLTQPALLFYWVIGDVDSPYGYLQHLCVSLCVCVCVWVCGGGLMDVGVLP